LRFTNNTEALIFGSFHQGKEHRFHFQISNLISSCNIQIGGGLLAIAFPKKLLTKN
jgi:hypothetical protein